MYGSFMLKFIWSKQETHYCDIDSLYISRPIN